MIVDPDFLDHWRTRMLVDALGGDESAPLYVIRIWGHCQQRRADAFAMPAAGLKALCRAPGDAAALETALIDAGFIERDGLTLRVPKWSEKNASLIAAWKNGGKGGRPKTEPEENPPETQGEPNGNPEQTNAEPIRLREEKEPSPPTVKKGRASALPAPENVDPGVWSDWLALRKAKRAPVTATVIASATTEAASAGMTLEAFLRVWCARGSQGLQADWLKPHERASPQPMTFRERDAANAAARVHEITGGLAVAKPITRRNDALQEVFDATAPARLG